MVKASPLVAKSNVSSSTEAHPLVTLGLFCGIGLLLSVLAIIADQHLPGEWF
jgi:hypothetical protein